jgi:hypothetical protein
VTKNILDGGAGGIIKDYARRSMIQLQ